jgi:alpha-L-fucosidase 2
MGSFLWLLAAFVQWTSAATITAPNSKSIPSRLWQTSAGTQWNDCFLIGNGRLGGSILGGAQTETIWLNEDSFWNGHLQSRINANALKSMPGIRSDIVSGNYGAAQSSASANYDGTPSSARNYNTLGTMSIVMSHGSSVSNYERYLDTADATSGVYYTAGGVTYFREYISSAPAGIMAIRVAASQAGAVSFSVNMARGNTQSSAATSDTITISDNSGGNSPMTFTAGVRVVTTGSSKATVSTSGNKVTVSGADEAWIFVQAWTDYRQSNQKSKVLSDLAAVTESYPDMRSAHVADYQSFFNRASFSFGSSSSSQKGMTTAQRISAMGSTYDPELALLFMQFGRYLLISSSRNGTLPANLQGIWNSETNPMWGSRFTININLRKLCCAASQKKTIGSSNIVLLLLLEMNYWPAFVTSELLIGLCCVGYHCTHILGTDKSRQTSSMASTSPSSISSTRSTRTVR